MGVCFVAFTVNDDKIETVLNEPALIWRLYEPESHDLYLNEIGAGKKPNFLAKLFGAREIKAPDPLPCFEFEDNEKFEIDLDKSWDGINYCIKKLLDNDTPNIFEDGTPIGNIEVGYGPAMFFMSAQVHMMAKGLAHISSINLLDSYLPSDMKKVYPHGLWRSNSVELKAYLTENYETLKHFVLNASQNNRGLVIVFI